MYIRSSFPLPHGGCTRLQGEKGIRSHCSLQPGACSYDSFPGPIDSAFPVCVPISGITFSILPVNIDIEEDHKDFPPCMMPH